jgi:hypothetical protein
VRHNRLTRRCTETRHFATYNPAAEAGKRSPASTGRGARGEAARRDLSAGRERTSLRASRRHCRITQPRFTGYPMLRELGTSRCDHQTLSSNAPGDFVGGREGGEGRPAPARPTGGIVPSVERKECGLVPRRLPISPTIQFRPPAKWVTSPARSASVRLSAALGLPAS